MPRSRRRRGEGGMHASGNVCRFSSLRGYGRGGLSRSDLGHERSGHRAGIWRIVYVHWRWLIAERGGAGRVCFIAVRVLTVREQYSDDG